MKILGISCFYHDSAAALVVDGKIIAAVQEERFTRKKHDANFPSESVKWCLEKFGIKISDIDIVVFYDKPFIKFERILESYISYAPKGISQFLEAIPLWIKQKLWISELIQKELQYSGKILFSSHHESHAASAFYPSPFQEAAFLTMDGVGEWETTSFGVGKDNNLEIDYCMRFPHSLGLLYSSFTYFTGFRVNSGEYKLMGLAPYGQPKYFDLIMNNLLDLKEDGSFKLNMRYFSYAYSMRMINSKFEKLFGFKARKAETAITQEYMDVAASIQKVTEEIILRIVRFVHKTTGCENLCLAGGVALNCVGNGKILKEGLFKNIWIQPASGDAGGALGAALLIWYKHLKNPRTVINKLKDSQSASLLGPDYSNEDIESYLKLQDIKYKKVDKDKLADSVSDLLIKGNVIGWFQGKIEFGPRALGSRSIIGDSRDTQMQSRMNLKIKFRESFRPFAPSVLKEEASNWFDLNSESPYMLLVAPVKKNKHLDLNDTLKNKNGLESLKVVRSQIPAVTHVDYSARVQTVSREDNELYYDLIKSFFKKTGCPVIINTSFNVRGEPLVCSPADAFKCFVRTEMDYLVMGNFVLDKKDQKPIEKDANWQKEFRLD